MTWSYFQSKHIAKRPFVGLTAVQPACSSILPRLQFSSPSALTEQTDLSLFLGICLNVSLIGIANANDKCVPTATDSQTSRSISAPKASEAPPKEEFDMKIVLLDLAAKGQKQTDEFSKQLEKSSDSGHNTAKIAKVFLLSLLATIIGTFLGLWVFRKLSDWLLHAHPSA